VTDDVVYSRNVATESEILAHLIETDGQFIPRLSSRVQLPSYSTKIASKAVRFEAWTNGVLVGLIAAYVNDDVNRIAYITSVSVLTSRGGEGIASELLTRCTQYAAGEGMLRITLDVDSENSAARRLYENNGFVQDSARQGVLSMSRACEIEETR
jgi:ribosomal protein S18 acetylase RimI-like enzyme